MVIVQQAVQTALGMYWLDDEDPLKEVFRDHKGEMEQYGIWISRISFALLGPSLATRLLRTCGQEMTKFAYWWAIPILQFLWASFVLDTWQYFLHRYMHTNRFLYRHIHSLHHRLYCPYAFGALYNHPVEGFLLDTLGTAVAHWASMMSTRQAIILFGFSTLKTVDDHCGCGSSSRSAVLSAAFG
jgi:sphinganine C4-monooxygenase